VEFEMGARKSLMAGNWKMHTLCADGCRLAVDVAGTYKKI
jgi:hypothetical protein